MSIHNRLTGAGCALLLATGGLACGGSRAESKAPATAAASQTTPPAPPPQSRPPRAPQSGGPGAAGPQAANPDGADDQDDAELVVSREVVARCPMVRMVREHVEEFDPDMVWLAVLESIAQCMSADGPMAAQLIGVSGDEEHRHVVREVLGSRGVAPTRVVAKPVSPGAAECQGDTDCSKRVEITIVEPQAP